VFGVCHTVSGPSSPRTEIDWISTYSTGRMVSQETSNITCGGGGKGEERIARVPAALRTHPAKCVVFVIARVALERLVH